MNLKYILKVLALVGVVFFTSSCSISKNDSEASLKGAIDEFNEAYKKGDVSTLERMITSDYTHTNNSWKSFGKEKWLGYMESRAQKIQSGELVIDTYQMDQLEIKVRDNMAFVTARIISKGSENGVAFSKSFRVSNYWVHENDQWIRAGFHDTPIEP